MAWVAAGVAIGGALLGAHSSKKAASAQTQAADESVAEQRRQYDQTRTDQLPWLTAGTKALGELDNAGTAFTASPDYAFRRSEGTRGIESSFAAGGMGRSGNALKALAEFNSNLAAGEFSDWWNRKAGVAGVGQTAATNLGAAGAHSSALVSNSLLEKGDARASGVANSTNALLGGAQDYFRLRQNKPVKPKWPSGGVDPYKY